MMRPLHAAYAIAALLGSSAAVPAGDDDAAGAAPSPELLEYLAEFEALDNGRWLDPLDLAEDANGDNDAAADQPRSTAR